MNLELVTAPVGAPLTLAETKAHLRVEVPDEDALIQGLIDAVTQHLDGRTGTLRRALQTQTWTVRFDRFPSGRGPIELPFPPLRSVGSITYVDRAGDEQTLAPSVYVVDPHAFVGRVLPAADQCWPCADDIENAVRITFTAGYGNAVDVPQPIKQAMLLIIGHYHRHREFTVAGVTITEIPMAADALLGPFRVPRVA